MKSKIRGILLLIFLVAVGCARIEEYDNIGKLKKMSIDVYMEDVPYTRSVINCNGTFSWSDNDYIGVFGTDFENACFSFQSQEGNHAMFSGSVNSADGRPQLAYYPYAERVSLDGGDEILKYIIPAKMNITDGNTIPMIGQFIDNSIEFKYIGGGLQFKIEGLDNHTYKKIVVCVSGESSPDLAGEAVVYINEKSEYLYKIKEGYREVEYDLSALDQNVTSCMCYLPLQIGEYDKLTLKIIDKEDEVAIEKSLSKVTVSRAHIIDTPPIHLQKCIYMYDLPEEWLSFTDWDGAFYLSNELLIGYKDENVKGSCYIISNLSNIGNSEAGLDIMTVSFDENNKLSNIIYGDKSYKYTYDSSSDSYDVKEFSSAQNSIYKISSSASSVLVGTKANVDSEHMSRLYDIRNALSGFQNEPMPGSTQEAIDQIPTTILDMAEAQLNVLSWRSGNFSANSRQPVGLIRPAIELIYVETNIINNEAYESFLGNAEIVLNYDKGLNNNYTLTGNVVNINTRYNNSLGVGYIEQGFLIRRVPLESDNIYSSDNMFYHSNNVERHEIGTMPLILESGYCYYIRAYLGTNQYYNIFSYSDIIRITAEHPIISRVDVSDGKFINGEFYYKVRVVGAGTLSNASRCYMFVGKNSIDRTKLSKQWSADNNIVEFDLYLSREEMDYEYKCEKDFWWVWCSMNEKSSFRELDKNNKDQYETISLEYEIEPSLDIEVQIISGPTSINGTKANEDDLKIIRYCVTVKVEGSGWLLSILTKSSDGTLSQSETPSEDNQTFSYEAAAVFKDESSLPTISCEGILVDGNKIYGNQEINLASLLQ